MEEKIQPVISKMVMEILQSKPNDPIPQMYNILTQVHHEQEREKEEKAQAERGDLLSDNQWEEYQSLMRIKKELLS